MRWGRTAAASRPLQPPPLLLTLLLAAGGDWAATATAGAAAGDDLGDQVMSLPGYGAPKTRQYSGFQDATPDGKNKLFYYFVEADVGSDSEDTPFLIWLNGGPGASSLMGLLVENLGPQKITPNATLVDNVHRITKKYHLMAVDNPVGAGFSFTETGAYVRTEEEMRTQFVHALRGFYAAHPEYKRNPLWLTGESYGGKYIPNIAFELASTAQEIPLQGIVVGNGMYNEPVQYSSIGEVAYGEGVIDENLLKEVHLREERCIDALAKKEPRAGDFCENVTVRWLYTGPNATAGQLFYYDFGMKDAGELDIITDKMGTYLNRPDVKAALHAGNATWVNADEVGPVARALMPDWAIPSFPMVEKLLDMGKEVFIYNGVRDGSVCNHIGNLRSLLALDWSGKEEFGASRNAPWPSVQNVMGHIRGARNLRFATVMRTGHLVPTVQPEAFAVLLDMAIKAPTGLRADTIVV